MMIYSTTILALPCVLLVWAIDGYLFILFVGSVCRRFSPVASDPAWRRNLAALADPVPERVGRWLAGRTTSDVPRWAGWALVVCGLFLARSVLLRLALAGA